MKLENMPSEISQAKEDKYCIIHLHEVPRVIKLIETKLEVSRNCEERGKVGGYCLMGSEFMMKKSSGNGEW